MSMASGELWQVEVQTGEVYEVELDILKQWIADGHVQPSDKVRKGNLRWVVAGRTPALRRVFHGAATVEQQFAPESHISQTPEQAPHTDSRTVLPAASDETLVAPSSAVTTSSAPDAPHAFDSAFVAAPLNESADASAITANACCNHPHVASRYVCRMCAAALCAECPNFVGGSKVPLCPLCGDLCKPYAEAAQASARADYQSTAFGFNDFQQALRYPFKHVVALLFGALIYGVLLLVGWRGQALACAILFGCITHVINGVVAGKFDRSFMPDFDASSWSEAVLQPLLLSFGIIIVSWGPIIVLSVALMFGWLTGVGAPSPLHVAAAAQAQAERAQVKSDLNAVMDANSTDPDKEAEAMRRLDPLHAGQYADPNAKRAQTEDIAAEESAASPLWQLLKAPAWAICLGALAFAWGVFYYPMALAVAGYTEDFKSTINPLVGLDTIRRMGATYAKAFTMYLGVQAIAFALSAVANLVFAPFDMPFVGNLPAKFVDGTITFYTSLVIAFILGLALYKCADKLDINVD